MPFDNQDSSPQVDVLKKEFHEQASYRNGLLDFIADELPRWRDRPDLKSRTSETGITSHLCGHLNSAARRTPGWDNLQFRVEEPDTLNKGRKIDLVPSPCDAIIWIDDCMYADCNTLMPIECKRFPIPKDRDEREYVISKDSSTGGIHRFKEGHHGSEDTFAGMIGYIQQETTEIWNERVAEWINDLAGKQSGWTTNDLLNLKSVDTAQGLMTLSSSHERTKNLQKIEIRHLWIDMNHKPATA